MDSPHRLAMARAFLEDETDSVRRLIPLARLSPDQAARADTLARQLVQKVRAGRGASGGIDAFLQEYALSSAEGVVLMCLAEALLRIPDAETADLLIKDKIGSGRWESHLGKSDSLFVNASTWGLLLTGRVVKLDDAPRDLANAWKRVVARSGEPVIRQAMLAAMRMMGEQFVLGRTIGEALRRGRDKRKAGYRYSFDMLGEAAWTASDAQRYFDSYQAALRAVAAEQSSGADVFARDSISIKLSALHPRYEDAKASRLMTELLPRIESLAVQARDAGMGLTIDAEEAERLDISLDLFEALARSAALRGYDGLGLAVQAYQKRAPSVIAWLVELASATQRRIPVRLVKGAYWDSEIKRAQELGLPGYPVFTRKASTDVSYLACARALLAGGAAFFPQFATHNAHTLAAVTALAEGRGGFEFQKLHGMGQALYDRVAGAGNLGLPVRIYAPVGGHEDLLAYLVRRLLENGANTSFVNRLADDEAPIAEIVADPVATAEATDPIPHPRIPLPRDIFPGRANSNGLLLADRAVRAPLAADIERALTAPQRAAPAAGGGGAGAPVTDPADRRRIVGEVVAATSGQAAEAVRTAAAAQHAWDARGGDARASILERAADLFEAEMPLLLGLCIREAGKTIANALADVREAIDFLRYYAQAARREFGAEEALPGPTGEHNALSLHGRGVFACISPWNFPVAIFTGQVAAALAAGNAVAAKPAEQTPLAASACVRLLHRAGVPEDVLAFLPGDGASIGGALVGDARVAGVAFTGSTETARLINRALAARDGALVPLIAETGGLNAMIVDSTALPEQVARDVLQSAFDSAGQRCSALRVLFVQEDAASRILDVITGAMDELAVGDPMDPATDIGPVIDEDALLMLKAHAARMDREAKLLRRAKLGPDCAYGSFFAPVAYEIGDAGALTREVFGPILHVVRFAGSRIDRVLDAVNASGYGLTLSVHSRVDSTVKTVRERARVGNLYVNRNQIGAVVGAQPFGGEGLSGTGPKAGGPRYLHRFALERTVSVNTTAAGGNTALMTMG